MSYYNSQQSLSQKIDSIILDLYHKSFEILIKSRNGYCVPKTKDKIISFADSNDYCRQILQNWKVNITQPLYIDIYYVDSSGQKLYLLERWNFQYLRKDDHKEARVDITNLKAVTFLRTLYSFMRLLPACQLSYSTKTLSAFAFQVYDNPDVNESSSFNVDSLAYDFPILNTSKGILNVSVRYVEGYILQVLLCCQIYV